MEIDRGLIGGSTVLMLLALLENGDRYGYEIIKELKEAAVIYALSISELCR